MKIILEATKSKSPDFLRYWGPASQPASLRCIYNSCSSYTINAPILIERRGEEHRAKLT